MNEWVDLSIAPLELFLGPYGELFWQEADICIRIVSSVSLLCLGSRGNQFHKSSLVQHHRCICRFIHRSLRRCNR